MAKKYDHIHKYERKKLGKYIVFKCAVAGCPHFIRKELAENRMSICWRCEQPFILTKHALTLERPHCVACTKTRKPKDAEHKDRLREILESLGKI